MAHYEEGTHECIVEGLVFDKSEQKKTPYIGVVIRPINGQYDRTVRLWVTEKRASSRSRRCRLTLATRATDSAS